MEDNFSLSLRLASLLSIEIVQRHVARQQALDAAVGRA